MLRVCRQALEQDQIAVGKRPYRRYIILGIVGELHGEARSAIADHDVQAEQRCLVFGHETFELQIAQTQFQIFNWHQIEHHVEEWPAPVDAGGREVLNQLVVGVGLMCKGFGQGGPYLTQQILEVFNPRNAIPQNKSVQVQPDLGIKLGQLTARNRGADAISS